MIARHKCGTLAQSIFSSQQNQPKPCLQYVIHRQICLRSLCCSSWCIRPGGEFMCLTLSDHVLIPSSLLLSQGGGGSAWSSASLLASSSCWSGSGIWGWRAQEFAMFAHILSARETHLLHFTPTTPSKSWCNRFFPAIFRTKIAKARLAIPWYLAPLFFTKALGSRRQRRRRPGRQSV